MNAEGEKSFSDRIGSWMTLIAWVCFIAVLAYAFNLIVQKQNNPNQSVSTALVGGTKEITLTRNKFGHYVANGEINGHEVIFLLDTGATDVALSSQMAKRLNLKQGRPFKVSTANGIAKAYRTRLDAISIGGIGLKDIPASILNNGPDNQVLLGMAFLKHLELIQRGDQLTIRQ